MTHLDFIVWMLGYPAVICAIEIAEYQWKGGKQKENSTEVKGLAALFNLATWFGVGAHLF